MSGRPTNGPLVEPAESLRLCAPTCAGMIGMLLLVGRAGRVSVACAGTLAFVSLRLKLANFEGGSGLEPEGLDQLFLRKSSR